MSKIDLAVLDGDFSQSIDRDRAVIRALVEVKYVRNTHRICFGNAEDEVSPTLLSLQRQLHTFEKNTHGHFRVRLSGRRKDIYGLVFASYVDCGGNSSAEGRFFKKVEERARAAGFSYYDLKGYAWLQEVFLRQQVEAMNRTFRVSLRAGLWRLAS